MFVVNSRDNLLQDIWCFCKSEYNPIILLDDDQHIDSTIQLHNMTYGFSIIYASTNYIHRRNLWNSLNNTHANTPCTYIGDFNVIINASECKGNHIPAKIPMQDFFKWTYLNQLIHIPTLGNALSWCNGRKGRNRTKKMLDREFCNLPLIDTCHSVTCKTLTKTNSDHYPILLFINLDNVVFKCQFKFHKMWTLDEDCNRLVREV